MLLLLGKQQTAKKKKKSYADIHTIIVSWLRKELCLQGLKEEDER